MPDNKPVTHIQLDVAVIGGGIAGLWLGNRLRSQGYRCAVFEQKALGSDQTIASQGMIHGGMKYTLSGALSGASEAVADMPRHWRACLCGEGDVDLRNTRLLSDHFFLWSSNSIASRLTSFFASKATRGRVDSVSADKYPPLLRHADFSGNLYKLVDIVLDVPSLVTNLAHNLEGHTFLLDWSQARLHKNHDGELYLLIEQDSQILHISARRFVFTAGKGNRELLAGIGLMAPAMQLRPLQQVMVKHYHSYLFYGHCLGAETTPRLTISSHKLRQYEYVWYLGGTLAEKGVDLEPAALIDTAKTELAELLPWVDLSNAEWATLPIERAEPRQPGFMRPDNAFAEPAEGAANLIVAWPTKLTLAPNLANQVMELLYQSNIQPDGAQHFENPLHGMLPTPPLAPAPWELAFPPAMSAEDALDLKFFTPEEDD